MTHSIRTYLLINLLLSVTIITSLSIIGNLFLAHKDIQLQMDAELIRSTLRMRAIFSAPINKKQLPLIQEKLRHENKYLTNVKMHSPLQSAAVNQAEKNLEFQIWDAKGKLILYSQNAIKTPFSDGKVGLSTSWIHNQKWHVSTAHDNENHFTIMVAERADYRQQLENRLTQDSIVVMLITYPILGFLIWAIVGRGLATLRRVANEVHQRAPGYLEPVNKDALPSEIEPLVSELNSLFSRLKAAFEREKRFTGDAAHELKTPLAALTTQTQVALRAQTETEKKEALLKVLYSVRRSSHVIQQLLTLSRMEPETGLSDPVSVNLAKEAMEIISMLAPEAIEKNIELELIHPETDVTIKGNATMIDILLRNLLDNAIRYSPQDSFVEIEIREDKDNAILIVRDNGQGIPEKLRKRVFDRFFRVIGNNAPGSGLGLSIVQQIASLHNGKVELHTPASKKGIEFHVIFPKEKK